MVQPRKTNNWTVAGISANADNYHINEIGTWIIYDNDWSFAYNVTGDDAPDITQDSLRYFSVTTNWNIGSGIRVSGYGLKWDRPSQLTTDSGVAFYITVSRVPDMSISMITGSITVHYNSPVPDAFPTSWTTTINIQVGGQAQELK
jgi:hypothetical protein